MSDLPPFDRLTVGPDDVLVLRPQWPMSDAGMRRMVDALPSRLHGRVVVVDGDVAVFVADRLAAECGTTEESA